MKPVFPFLVVFPLLVSPGASAQTSEADRDLRFADRLYDREEWDLAISQYRVFLGKFADDARSPEARYRLADAMFRKGDLDVARGEFRSLLDVATDENRRMRILARLGEIAYREGEHAEAQSILSALLQNPLVPEVEEPVRFFLAKSHQAAADLAKAAGELQAVLDRFPRGRFAHFATVSLAEIYQAEGDKAKAAATLERFAENNLGSDDPEVRGLAEQALVGAAQLQVDLGNHQQAAQTFHRFAEAVPDSPKTVDALYGQTRALHQLGRFADAVPVVERLLPLIEQYQRTDLRMSARFLKGSSLFELKRYREALAEFDIVLALSEPPAAAADLHPVAAAHLVQCRFLLGELDQVIAAAEQFEQRFPGSDDLQGRLLFFKGQALAQEGRHSEAIVEFALLLNDYPDHALTPQATYQIGRSCLLDQQFDRAARNLTKYVERYPDTPEAPEALYFAAEATYRMQQYEPAAELFRRVVEGYPDSPRREAAHLRWGECHVFLRQYDRVFEIFGDFLSRYPDSAGCAEAYYYRGFVLQNRQDYAEAVRNYDELLARFPDSLYASDARLRKGLAQYNAKDNDAAAETFLALVNDASASARLDSNIYLWVGKYLVSNRRYVDALSVYERAARLFPADDVQEVSLFERAECLRRLDRCPDAVELYRSLSDRYPDGGYHYPAQYGLGVCMQAAGNHAGAADAFAEAQASTSNVLAASATFGYGEALRDLGRTEEAFTAFMKVALLFVSDELSPRAYLEMAGCQEALGDARKAREVYAELIEAYPESPQAKVARDKVGSATPAGG